MKVNPQINVTLLVALNLRYFSIQCLQLHTIIAFPNVFLFCHFCFLEWDLLSKKLHISLPRNKIGSLILLILLNYAKRIQVLRLWYNQASEIFQFSTEKVQAKHNPNDVRCTIEA